MCAGSGSRFEARAGARLAAPASHPVSLTRQSCSALVLRIERTVVLLLSTAFRSFLGADHSGMSIVVASFHAAVRSAHLLRAGSVRVAAGADASSRPVPLFCLIGWLPGPARGPARGCRRCRPGRVFARMPRSFSRRGCEGLETRPACAHDATVAFTMLGESRSPSAVWRLAPGQRFPTNPFVGGLPAAF